MDKKADADLKETAVTAVRKRRGGGKSRRITMTDIAREAECSQATVSFVLNRTDGVKISPETSARVIETALRLGYRPSSISGLLEPQVPSVTEGTIGFLVDQLATSPEAAIAIDSARQEAWRTGNIVISAQTMSDPGIEERAINTLIAAGVSSLIYMTIITRELKPNPMLYNLGVPLVLLNCYTADHAFPSVIPSEIAGGQGATKHLIERGHQRIGTILGEIWMDAAAGRLEGYRRALATADIAYDPELVVQGDWSTSGGYTATRKLLALKDPPTAIFCQNDRTAVGCYDALREAGLSIPHDVSVLGYDDEEISRHLRPRLTTCVLPHRVMGRWAIEHLEDRRPSPKKRYPITKIECSLITRDSVAPPRRGGNSKPLSYSRLV